MANPPAKCIGVSFTCDTDSSLGEPTDVFAFESWDVTSALASDEAIIDLTGVEGTDWIEETDPTTECVISLWAWILSYINQQHDVGYVQIYIRIYQIYINTKFRVKKQ